VWRHTVALIDRLFPPPRSFAVRLWDGTALPAAAGSPFTLALNHAGALRRMFAPPLERSLGEAFISGDFDLEGDICALFPLLDRLAARTFTLGALGALARAYLALPKTSAAPLAARGATGIRGRAAIQHQAVFEP